jgi:hypothetical protein
LDFACLWPKLLIKLVNTNLTPLEFLQSFKLLIFAVPTLGRRSSLISLVIADVVGANILGRSRLVVLAEILDHIVKTWLRVI